MQQTRTHIKILQEKNGKKPTLKLNKPVKKVDPMEVKRKNLRIKMIQTHLFLHLVHISLLKTKPYNGFRGNNYRKI